MWKVSGMWRYAIVWEFSRFKIMTVSYSRLVANGSSFGCFGSILCKWVEIYVSFKFFYNNRFIDVNMLFAI